MLSALSFLTILGRGREPNASTFGWFPALGFALGAALAATWWVTTEVTTSLLAAAVVATTDAVLTGSLHLDGLADSADGLLPHLERDRRLAIMRTPDVGAFGVIALVLALTLRVAALASARPALWLLPVVWATSRTLIAAIPAFVAPARTDSLATPLVGGARRALLLWLAPITAVATLFGAGRGVAVVVATIGGGLAVVHLARRRVGGWTGDVLGAAIVVGETVGLLAWATRP